MYIQIISNSTYDKENNTLESKRFKITLNKTPYINPSINIIDILLADKSLIEGAGETLMYSVLGLFNLNIILAIIFSSAMCYLLPLFNLIQLIALIPLLQIAIPENLRMFITDYLMFAHFKFDFLINPFHRWGLIDLSEVNYNPLNNNFEENGVNSRAYIVNYGGQLVIWAIIIVFYGPITIFAKVCKFKKFIKLKKAYEYEVLFTAFNEGYLELTLLSFLNIYGVNYIYIYIYYVYSSDLLQK